MTRETYFARVKMFSEATQTKVESMYDIPKLMSAMRAFGWFNAAYKLGEETVRLNDCVIMEFNEVAHGSAST